MRIVSDIHLSLPRAGLNYAEHRNNDIHTASGPAPGESLKYQDGQLEDERLSLFSSSDTDTMATRVPCLKASTP